MKAAYRVIYRSGLKWSEILDILQNEFSEGPAAAFGRFLPLVTRGIVNERRLPPGATVRLSEEATIELRPQARAG
jgi:UDP-N-acetylglucosamine acyltransferase